jgi:hypothetical protein
MEARICSNEDGRTAFSNGLCRPCYTENLAARKAAGEDVARGPGALLPRVTCALDGCDEIIPITSSRRGAYEAGRPIYHSREHRKEGASTKAWYECADDGCSVKIERYRCEVERQATGLVWCSDHKVRGGMKPRKGTSQPCACDCGQEVYLKPGLAAESAETGRLRFVDEKHKAAAQTGVPLVERITRECEHCGDRFESTPTRRSHGQRFCSPPCRNLAKRRKPGDRVLDARTGYVTLYLEHPDGPDEPCIRILEHRHVMERHIGRPLHPWETVHHMTGGFKGRSNNDVSNLELWSGRHPKGHRVEDVNEFCRRHLALYGDEREQVVYAEHGEAILREDESAA